MIKCLIFDLDGTLINTLKDIACSTNEILNEYNYPNIDIEKYKYFVGNGIKKLLERSLNYIGGNINLLEEIYHKFLINYNSKCLRFATLYNNIVQLLFYLKNNNILLFINTNKDQEIAKKMIDELLPNYFIYIYGDCIKYPRKPDPYIVNKIKREYKLKNNEMLFVGDSNVDILTAHNANIKAIGCTYGFRSEKELINSGADYLINDPLEIIKIINK